jgi:hypothetical protein
MGFEQHSLYVCWSMAMCASDGGSKIKFLSNLCELS